MNDLGIGETAETQEDRNVDGGDLLFSVFMDDEWLVPGGDTRFAGGLLLTNGNGNDGKGSHGEEMKQRLLDANLTIGSTASTTAKEEGVLGKGHSTDVKYQVGVLPTVKAAVAQHPFTNGAFSAILQSYKVCMFCLCLYYLFGVCMNE